MTIEKPHRVDHAYRQHLNARPDEIFPLLCPVRETQWVRGWDPHLVISASGFAEPSCIFTTDGDFGESTWFISALDRERYHIEFVKFTPGHLVTFVTITVFADGEQTSIAECRYQHTAIGEEGRKFVSDYTFDRYVQFMKNWEDELNHFLDSGRSADSSITQRG